MDCRTSQIALARFWRTINRKNAPICALLYRVEMDNVTLTTFHVYEYAFKLPLPVPFCLVHVIIYFSIIFVEFDFPSGVSASQQHKHRLGGVVAVWSK